MNYHQHFQIIAGGRDYNDRAAMEYHIRYLRARVRSLGQTLVVVSGGARGADRLADSVATELGIPSVVIPAEWDRHGRRAGYLRNVEMAKYVTEMQGNGHTADVVCFPGGVGTQMMREIADRYHLRCYQPRVLADA